MNREDAKDAKENLEFFASFAPLRFVITPRSLRALR
jgi:hypothetical protein